MSDAAMYAAKLAQECEHFEDLTHSVSQARAAVRLLVDHLYDTPTEKLDHTALQLLADSLCRSLDFAKLHEESIHTALIQGASYLRGSAEGAADRAEQAARSARRAVRR